MLLLFVYVTLNFHCLCMRRTNSTIAAGCLLAISATVLHKIFYLSFMVFSDDWSPFVGSLNLRALYILAYSLMQGRYYLKVILNIAE